MKCRSLGFASLTPETAIYRDIVVIKLHHLNQSRSKRITWLLEELGVDYEVVSYQRDSVTYLAPLALTQFHSLVKSPVIQEG